MSKKFEKLIEYVVNEDMEKARAIFHDLCVEKSRGIYENLLDEEELDKAEDEEELEESDDEDEDDDDDKVEESFRDDDDDDDDEFSDDLPAKDFVDDIEADEAGMTEEGEDEFGGDEFGTDDDMDMEMDGDDMEMDGEENIEDRVVDLEDALDDLEAKFNEIVDGGEYGDEDEEGADDMGMDFGDEEEEDGMDDFDMDDEGDEEETEESFVREYKEKVDTPSGDKEVGTGGSFSPNNKDVVAKKREKGSIDIGRGSKKEGSKPSVGSYADGMDPRDLGKKNGDGPKAKAPAAKKEDPGKGKGPVAKSHN